MKKIKKIAGIIAIAAVIGFVFWSCEEPTPDPDPTTNPCASGHAFSATIAATCTSASIPGNCSRCSVVNPEAVVSALNHHAPSGKEATCTEDGNTGTGICQRQGCGQTVTGTVIPKLGHDGLTAATAATCTTAGNSAEHGTCTRQGCGQVISGTVIAALGHSGLKQATAATCTVAGNSTEHGTCTRCSERFEGTVLSALGHITPSGTEATCITDGNSGTGKCKRDNCSETITGTVIPALGHTGLAAPTAATCTVTGNSEKNGTCSTCKQVISGTLLTALGHQGLNAATSATCTVAGNSAENGTCTRCSVTIPGTVLTALGHTGLKSASAATCSEVGNTSENGTCTRGCGYTLVGTVIPALGHQGLNAATAATCTVTGNSEKNGTCTRTGCGQIVTGTVLSALGHDHTSSFICKRPNCDHQYAVGDTGPAGGEIFYVNPEGFEVEGYTGNIGSFATYTAYYMEVAADFEDRSYQWGERVWIHDVTWSKWNDKVLTESIGKGRKDTQLIVNYYATDSYYSVYSAASCCATKSVTFDGIEFNDWFLPSIGELEKLRVVKHTDSKFNGKFIWSSSQYEPEYAERMYFASYGQPNMTYKNSSGLVIAIRAF